MTAVPAGQINNRIKAAAGRIDPAESRDLPVRHVDGADSWTISTSRSGFSGPNISGPYVLFYCEAA
jgi:hypothetical protein